MTTHLRRVSCWAAGSILLTFACSSDSQKGSPDTAGTVDSGSESSLSTGAGGTDPAPGGVGGSPGTSGAVNVGGAASRVALPASEVPQIWGALRAWAAEPAWGGVELGSTTSVGGAATGRNPTPNTSVGTAAPCKKNVNDAEVDAVRVHPLSRC